MQRKHSNKDLRMIEELRAAGWKPYRRSTLIWETPDRTKLISPLRGAYSAMREQNSNGN